VHGSDFFSVTGCNSRHFAVEVRRSTHTIANVWSFSVIIIIILYYAIYGSTQAHEYKKAKMHMKYDLKYITDIKAHSSAR